MTNILMSLAAGFLLTVGSGWFLKSNHQPEGSSPFLGTFLLTETLMQPVDPVYGYIWGVDIDGDTLAVGRQVRTSSAELPKEIVLYERIDSTWVEQAVLPRNSEDSADDLLFGGLFALAGDTLAVLGEQTVFVYQRDERGWRQAAELVIPTEAEENIGFLDLELDGDVLAVSHRSKNPNDSRGIVHIFERSGVEWAHTAELVADNGEAGSEFGGRIALDNETLAAMYRHRVGDENESAVYIFTHSNSKWNKAAEIPIQYEVPEEAEYSGLFDIALSNRTLFAQVAIQAIPGKLLIFAGDSSGANWSQQADLDIDNTLVNTDFGMETKLVATEQMAVVATVANGYNIQELYSFVATGTGWVRRNTWMNDHGIVLYYSSLATDGDTLVITELDRMHVFERIQSQLFLPLISSDIFLVR